MPMDFDKLNEKAEFVLTKPVEIGNRFTWEQLEPQMKKLGINREMLPEEDLKNLLNARRTNVLTMLKTDQYQTVTPIQGRLFVYDHPGHGPQVEIIPKEIVRNIPHRILGAELTPEDQLRLMKTGEVGRILTMRDKETSELFKGFVGYDKETNRITIFRQDRFVPPIQLLGVPISDKQRETLANHGVIRLKGLISKFDGSTFTADVQVKAHKRELGYTRVTQAALDAREQKKNNQEPIIAPQVSYTARQQARLDQDERWKNTLVTALDKEGNRVRKLAGDLSYSDQIMVKKGRNGQDDIFRPLTMITDESLKSPKAQAKQEILHYRAETLGKPIKAKRPATKQEIDLAIQKFSVIDAIQKRTPKKAVKENKAEATIPKMTQTKPKLPDDSRSANRKMKH